MCVDFECGYRFWFEENGEGEDIDVGIYVDLGLYLDLKWSEVKRSKVHPQLCFKSEGKSRNIDTVVPVLVLKRVF